ncbi:phosphotriesterase-related protein [Rhodnius prolixus]|uniref:Parathion hydrolase-related protein n=2 Tax=Rhodnius TaxID=13248 RepID=R4FNE8_RHOPR
MSVQTVLGEVQAGDLGVTLTHEHFNICFDNFFVKPPQNLSIFSDQDISLKNVGYIRQYPYSNKSNLKFYGKEVDDAVVEEMYWFKKNGGGTILENTTHGLGRNVKLMKTIMQNTGVNVILGTGHYVAGVQNKSTINETKEQIYNTMLKDLTNGCVEDISVKAGFIGEVGSCWPIHDFEKRCIEAVGMLQSNLKCAVSFHPGRHSDCPSEILRIFSEAGGNIHKANMSHLDRTISKEDKLLEFAQLGSYCQFDLFGVETSLYQFNPNIDMPSDAERINRIKLLINNGKANKILMSHDIHTKHRLVNFGGHGYSHIINNIIPQMESKGIEKSIIDQITIQNPATWLCSD